MVSIDFGILVIVYASIFRKDIADKKIKEVEEVEEVEEVQTQSYVF